ncbi:branched-chain amino acid transport system substrate-binding protein [Noviherbaspirillum suwonense]|uniref:Branched-chain amino acid transport system substrate-binding protein n=2 Tax=Noviherbaspirillum suwonense TaxID=1224511 RepID=A0ABY1QN58_9BURK|nr:branched-chain amino acid transport system substrate-binding protein [Noviherbaspirillum suwonense]
MDNRTKEKNMKRRTVNLALLAMLSGLASMPAFAQEALRIGLVAPFSGPYADYGRQMEAGIRTYMKQHGDKVAGRKVELLVRDTTGPSPELSRRLSQELVARDKVDFLAGYGFTPDALAAAPVAQQSKKPMVIMNAAGSVITTKSDYITRVSMTIAQNSAPMATWALKNKIRRVVTVVGDYAPGIDAETSFKTTFSRGGGEIVETIRVPLRSPDMAPYIQRVKDAKPDAVFLWVPSGEHSVSFMKNYSERGLAATGIRIIGTGDLTDEAMLPALGDATLGAITAFHYSAAHDTPENKAFVKLFQEVNPKVGQPNFMGVAGYDGMAAMAEVTKKLNGVIDGDKAMAVFRGMKLASPRGPLAIDLETRDVTQTVYIRKVEKVNGTLANVEFDKFVDVKDPGK